MVIYSKVTINGSTQDSINTTTLKKSISDFNSTSSFIISVNNHTGRYSSSFSLNDEVIIYADKDTNPPTTKLFAGIIENISYKGDPNKEIIEISGRDYGAILQDLNIDPIVYKNQEVSIIINDIIVHIRSSITRNNVNTTETTLERVTFNHTNVFDSLIKLAELSGFFFYVDEDKDLHFEKKDDTPSGLNIDNIITASRFEINDDQIYNKIWAYGGRTFTGANNKFTADGIGSEFTLDDNPHNTNVFVNDDLQSKGGIFNMDDPEYTTDLKYLVDFDRKGIIFVSGTSAGDNIPASGDIISIDYDRSKPIVTTNQDNTSIATYGTKEKVIIDKNILTFAEIDNMATSFLENNKDPKIQGTVSVKGIVDVTPGQTIVLNIPFENIVSQTYSILNAKYLFNPNNNLSENVLTLTLNKKIDNISDTIKSLILKQKELETEGLQGSLTTLETASDTTPIKHHYEVYAMSGTYFPFRFQTEGADIMDSSSAVLGPWELGSILLTSGGNI